MSLIYDMIEKKRARIIKKRNAIEVSRSQVVGMTEDGARIIENGDNKFVVSEFFDEGSTIKYHGDPRNIDPTHYKYKHRCFTVKDSEGNSKKLHIEVRKITDDGGYKIPLISAYFGKGEHFPEGHDSAFDVEDLDISNIHDIRYRVRDNEKASYFLDKFFIVTPEERKAYQEYAATLDMKERQEKEAEKIRAMQEQEARMKQEQEQKIQAEAKLKEEALKKAHQQKIEEEFFGQR